jgi:hypothetical protein
VRPGRGWRQGRAPQPGTRTHRAPAVIAARSDRPAPAVTAGRLALLDRVVQRPRAGQPAREGQARAGRPSGARSCPAGSRLVPACGPTRRPHPLGVSPGHRTSTQASSIPGHQPNSRRPGRATCHSRALTADRSMFRPTSRRRCRQRSRWPMRYRQPMARDSASGRRSPGTRRSYGWRPCSRASRACPRIWRPGCCRIRRCRSTRCCTTRCGTRCAGDSGTRWKEPVISGRPGGRPGCGRAGPVLVRIAAASGGTQHGWPRFSPPVLLAELVPAGRWVGSLA